MKYFFSAVLILASALAWAQNGSIRGKVLDDITNQPIPFATVVIQGTSTGASTDFDGNYVIENLEPGLVNIEASYVGYTKRTIFEIQVYNSKPTSLDIRLTQSATQLEAVEIKASPFTKKEESPVSMRTINSAEIMRNPGGNRDISKVLQALSGVASSASFRNDIIIRGGAPSENRFYLDGVEVPNINHFATQGSSGGPVGMLNVNFIEEVDFYSGAFPSNRGNALSAVLEFKQKEGNRNKLEKNFMVGSSDFGLTLDGPLGKKSSFIFSVRRSYLQLLFRALKLPFLPAYNDAQFKTTINLNTKNKITIVGLGAYDDFELNQKVNKNITDPELIERNNYILGNIPVSDQWNYTLGVNYQHFMKKSFQTFVLSRNHLNNKAVKYFDNDDSDPNKLLLDYESQEIENKFRFEHTYRQDGWKINAGLGVENVTYTNQTFNKIDVGGMVQTIDFESSLNFSKFALFAQASKSLLAGRLQLSAGIRTDFNDYSDDMSNPLDQLSPRLSVSYSLNDKWSLNGNVGVFYQLPPYTTLGFKASDAFVNKSNGLKYIEARHAVLGVEYNVSKTAKATVEGFYKAYDRYPFLLNDSITLANLGSDFGIIGNEAVTSISEGRSYGLEFLFQQKMAKGFYGILAYTVVRSEFEDKDGKLIPSAWDNGHVVSLTGGKKFKKNWEVGVRWRFLGGAPYTPYDLQTSSLIAVWDVNGQGVLDYNNLNTGRTGAGHGLDIRIDKRFYFDKWSLNVYFDVQNAYNQQQTLQPYVDVVRDASGNALIDENDPSRYQTKLVSNANGTFLPSLGLMIEF